MTYNKVKKEYLFQGEVCSKCGVNLFEVESRVREEIKKKIKGMSFDISIFDKPAFPVQIVKNLHKQVLKTLEGGE